jgi:hypothetical protein
VYGAKPRAKEVPEGETSNEASDSQASSSAG